MEALDVTLYIFLMCMEHDGHNLERHTPVYIKTHNSQKQAIKLRNSKASNYNIV